VQLATSFIGRLTPEGVGWLLLNQRYLERSGLSRGSAMSALALALSATPALAAGSPISRITGPAAEMTDGGTLCGYQFTGGFVTVTFRTADLVDGEIEAAHLMFQGVVAERDGASYRVEAVEIYNDLKGTSPQGQVHQPGRRGRRQHQRRVPSGPGLRSDPGEPVQRCPRHHGERQLPPAVSPAGETSEPGSQPPGGGRSVMGEAGQPSSAR
jgi:hypothetical protein